jgi:SAM-dependent methyltransferase
MTMIRAILRNAGINPQRLASALRGWPRYARDRSAFRKLLAASEWTWSRELPILNEWDESAGGLGDYFFQDQLVASWIFEAKPRRHVDVGSRLDGFIGSLSVFREVEVIDIRPQPSPVRNVRFHQLDLMRPLPPEWIGCTDSLSCLHSIEHFGLGRYGDTLDADGHLKGLSQLKKMVKPGGIFYLSTPIGHERVEFNAHRVFAAETLLGWFAEDWKIERSAVIDDASRVREKPGAMAIREFTGNLGVGIVAARMDDNPIALPRA